MGFAVLGPSFAKTSWGEHSTGNSDVLLRTQSETRAVGRDFSIKEHWKNTKQGIELSFSVPYLWKYHTE